MKRLLALVICLVSLFSVASAANGKVYMSGEAPNFPSTDSLLEIWVLPFSDADCAIVKVGDEFMLVDSGDSDNYQTLVSQLTVLGATNIKYFFNTHPHYSAAGGFVSLTRNRNFQIGEFLTAFPQGFSTDGSKQQNIVAAANRASIPVTKVSNFSTFYMGDAQMTVYQHTFKNGNVDNSSASLLIEFNGSTILFTGDQGNDGQAKLIQDNPYIGKIDIMKAPNHGYDGIRYDVIDGLRPDLVYIPGGSASSKEAQQTLDTNNIPYLFASRGLIHMVTNGSYWIVDQELYSQFQSTVWGY